MAESAGSDRTLTSSTQAPAPVAFSPVQDDVLLYMETGADGADTLVFYSFSSHAKLRAIRLDCMASCLQAVAAGPLTLVAVGMRDGRTLLLDSGSGQLHEFGALSDQVSDVRFSPNGQCLVTSGGRQLFVWNVDVFE
jgi:WD40 repeat protein